jgi:chromosomal replication initiator protein
MALGDDVALTIATAIRSNVRELEGALLQLSARSSITGRSIDKEFADEVLKDLVSATPQGFSIESIQREVATYFDIKLHDLRGPKRLQSVARPRMIAMYLARKLTRSSFPEIGSHFGGKDHSTVISAVRKIERLVAEDSNLRSVVTTLESHLRQR